MRGRTSFTVMSISNVAVLVALLVSGLGLMNTPAALAGHYKVINFFWHDRLLIADPSAFVILQPLVGNLSKTNPVQSFFGFAAVFDDALTVSPDQDSLEIGRGRGFYIADQNSTTIPAIEFSWTAEFNNASGYTPGSTLTFKGLSRITDPVREIAIVGGTGDFRVARGWAVITAYNLTGTYANLNFTAHFKYGF